MYDGGTGADPAASKEEYLRRLLEKAEPDKSTKATYRKLALATELRKSTDAASVGTSPTSSSKAEENSARLWDASGNEITADMVEKADQGQLEVWANLDAGWDNEVMPLIEGRLEALRKASSLPSVETPVASSKPVSSPGGTDVGSKSKPADKRRSAQEIFEESVRGHQLKRQLISMYEVNAKLAEEVRDKFDKDSNPLLPEELLGRLAGANLLWHDHETYRVGTGSQNGVVYKFYVSKIGGIDVGEWHVHWGSKNAAESPGWKRGRSGPKSGGDNVAVMMKLIGKNDWGNIKGSSGSRKLASE